MLTKPRIINVMGTDIRVEFRKSADDKKLSNADGYFDHSAGLVVVLIPEPDENTVENLERYQKQVLRHELTHAFLYESGLYGSSGSADAWASNEEMVDWFAIQSPKIFRVFQKEGLLDV